MYVRSQIVLGGSRKPEPLFTGDNVVPHRTAAKVDVEVREAALDAHDAVLPDLGPLKLALAKRWPNLRQTASNSRRRRRCIV